MYAVVYGPEWEDIAYFADMKKAMTKLIIQNFANNRFHPIMHEYHHDGDGVYRQTKHEYSVDMKALEDLGITTLEQFRALEDVSLALDCVKDMYQSIAT